MGQRERATENRNLEQVASEARGSSVTASRLRDPNRKLISRVTGQPLINGPLTSYLYDEESPQYLFFALKGLELHEFEETDPQIVAPSVLLITDQRTLFIYIENETTQSFSIDHSVLEGVTSTRVSRTPRAEFVTSFQLITAKFSFSDRHLSELSDATAYITQKAEITDTERATGFDLHDLTNAQEQFGEQLSTLRDIVNRSDIIPITKCAVRGAVIGANQKPDATRLGFTLGAGFGIWSTSHSPPGDPTRLESIDPSETAEAMLHYQALFRTEESEYGELLGGVLGVVISFEQQITGGSIASSVADLGIEPLVKILRPEGDLEASSEPPSDEVESCSKEIAELLSIDFFGRVADPR